MSSYFSKDGEHGGDDKDDDRFECDEKVMAMISIADPLVQLCYDDSRKLLIARSLKSSLQVGLDIHVATDDWLSTNSINLL